MSPTARRESVTSQSAGLIDAGRKVLVDNYGPAQLALTWGEGARVRDADGREYVDLGCGIGVTSFGHRHPLIVKAVKAQLDRLWHVSNLYCTEPAVALAKDLVARSFASRVFFCNSGTEATEAAIKLVRKAASATRPEERRVILTFEGGFHGRSLAAVTATAQPKYHAGFEPLPGGFRYCTFNDVAALDAALDQDVCAVIVEPVQGEGGVVPAQPGFLTELRRLCNERNAFVVVDEVQCGMGRTGKLWAHEWEEGFEPDAMTTAKALGAGLPIGALLVGDRLADALTPGSHGSTFGGNPVVCAGAQAALSLACDADILANVTRQSSRLRASVEEIGREFGLFSDVRGVGLMIGAELLPERADRLGELLVACRKRGVIILQAGPRVLRFLPPLVIDDATLDEAMAGLRDAVMAVFGAS